MLTNVCGTGGVWREDEVHDLPPQQAKAWIDNGQAEPVADKRADSRRTSTRQRRETR